MRVRKMTSRRECSFNRRAQVDSDHLPSPPLRRQLSMTSFATPAFEYHLIFEKRRPDWGYPTKKLLVIFIIGLSEMLPLPAEAGGGSGFLCFNIFECSKAWDAAFDWPRT